MATSRDVQEIISKLSSDKAKIRDEGIRLLSIWMEGEKSISFCKLLGQNTARIKPGDIPKDDTWPFLLTVLTKCIVLEISASKKRPPKLILAKILRTAIQRAEDAKFSGKTLLLLSAAKWLFNHILDVIRDVPSFHSEYSIILRILLSVEEYSYEMRKRVYCSLVLLYMKKVGTATIGNSKVQSNTKEELFRHILTLHVLLENPPGDFPENIRENIVMGFVEIFSQVREEGKISRKLIDCINTYLLKDGPNLGCQSMEIHCSVQEFVFRYWLTTHDRVLKNSLILYGKIQLKLNRCSEGGPLIEQLLDVIGKELDQSNIAGTGMSWIDPSRDDKIYNLASSQQDLMELAATVFYQACMNNLKVLNQEKRLKTEHVADRLKGGLMSGKWLWAGSFYFLIHKYGHRIDQSLLIYWFESISKNFDRILNESNSAHSYDCLPWLLRSLQELSSVLLVPTHEEVQCPSHSLDETLRGRGSWHIIWSCLIHGLPMFSNVTQVADAALTVLGNMISKDLIGVPNVPQDVWELRIFKHMPSASSLYFIICYFSRRGVQGDLPDVFHLRKNLLRAALEMVNYKENFLLDEQMVILLPAAIFSLCAGCSFLPCYRRFFKYLDAMGDCFKMEENVLGLEYEESEYSLEILAKIGDRDFAKVSQAVHHHSIRLPREIWQPLVHEMEEYFLMIGKPDQKVEKMALSDLFFICSLLCNCVYNSSYLTRLRDEKSLYLTELLGYILRVLDHISVVIDENLNEFKSHGCLGSGSIFDLTGTTISSLRSFICCPLFVSWRDVNITDGKLSASIIQSTEKLLLSLAKMFKELSSHTSSVSVASDVLELFPASSIASQSSHSISECGVRFVDMELDAENSSKDVDSITGGRSNVPGISFSSVQCKLNITSAISLFFSMLPVITWDVMFDLLKKENDAKVCENILFSLCEHFVCSAGNLSALVNSIGDMMNASGNRKTCCAYMLTAIRHLLRALLPSSSGEQDGNTRHSERAIISNQNLAPLGDLVNRIAEIGLPDWSSRVKLIDCIHYFILLDPCIGQAMVARLLAMLRDNDYQVRLFLARRVGALFQTWDGHDELFQDICSNFGIHLVMASKEKVVTAREYLAAGAQSRPVVETALITLGHLAFVSEKVELEVIFIMCAVAAIEPCHRELVLAILDNLSKQLQYSSRTKYMEELLGPILSHWVACEVSVVALVEIRDVFVVRTEANSFMQFCCPWLLPPLVLRQDISNLNLVSVIAGQPLSMLVQKHFVPIFGVCMALQCSSKSNNEFGEVVLRSSILRIAEISEQERDDLIKKHMVSIVNCLLSLSSSSLDPPMPFFSRDIVEKSVRMVIDGFLEMDKHPATAGVADKLNILRPDRVFKFLVEIHYQITKAIHPRHKCHRLSAIEALINIIGHRAAVASTSYYVINLVGLLIENHALQDQCCIILSKLLSVFKSDLTKNVISVFGEQLQFLVSKLVACCIPSENREIAEESSRIVSLLHDLTVDADPSLHDFIRELEPFPELECLRRIRTFHDELCKAYSPRDQFLKYVRRTCYLPQRLRLWSLQTLHKKLITGKIVLPERKACDDSLELNYWNFDPEVVSAVWSLVGMCGLSGANDISALVADFISRVGIGDPHRVVFRLPGDSSERNLSQPYCPSNFFKVGSSTELGASEELLINLMRLLKKYLLDDSVKIVDITSRTLRGILSTEQGQRSLICFDSYETSLVAVHSKGVNYELVEKLLLDSENKPCETEEAISSLGSSLWETHGKTYQTWICPLVHWLIGYSNDIILRLCQDIVLLKDEVAEFLFPHVLINLAGRKDLNYDLCQIISLKVEENIFIESNKLIKSIQVWLDVLNRLRSYHVAEKTGSSSIQFKSGKHSTCTRTRHTPEKSKDHSCIQNIVVLSSSVWKKVYWLPINYLVVAKAAISCGSYFTAVMYVEHWCEEHFNGLTLGSPDFSNLEMLPPHIELLVAAVTQINEPDSIYGIIQTHKLTSQIITFEHEGNWSKALEYYDLLARTAALGHGGGLFGQSVSGSSHRNLSVSSSMGGQETSDWKSHKGLMRSLQQTGCTHLLDVYCQGLTSRKGHFQHDPEFSELQYEAAWRAGNWEFSFLPMEYNSLQSAQCVKKGHFNEDLHSCLRAFQEGDSAEFHMKLLDLKKDLVLSISNASRESTGYINSAIVKLQILDHLNMAWDMRWKPHSRQEHKLFLEFNKISHEPVIPTMVQMKGLNSDWNLILKQTQQHLNLIEPFISFRRVLLQILNCKEFTKEHLLQSAATLRKGSRFSLATAALHEFKLLCGGTEQEATSYFSSLGRLEEAKLLRAQGQHEMAINLARYILNNYHLEEEASNLYRLIGKWLAETRSSNSRTVLEQYLKKSVELAKLNKSTDKSVFRQCQTYFNLAHYTDALFKSYEDRLASSEWQAAMRLRKHKTKELDALIRRLKGSTKGEKTDYSVKILELQKQLTLDREEAEKLQDDRDNFLNLALEGYQRCLVIGGKYDMRVVFRLVSLWFSLSSQQSVVKNMLCAVKEVQSYKFIPLMYQIASRMGSSKDGQGSFNFQTALVSLVKKMAIDHPYHTVFQLLALANGDRVKDKQRSRNSFIVDMDKKLAAENLLNELSSYHGAVIRQMKQMVEIYIKLAELETKKEETNKQIPLPREIRSLRQLELVPVVTATFPVDPTCQYNDGSFPHFKGLGDSIMVMNGINAPKVVECLGSDGYKYRQLAKSGNDDLRQDAVMEQFFSLVNTFLQSHRGTWRRRLRIRTYKVVPFTPSAGVLEWVDRTVPLGEYLLGSTRNGGAHRRYGVGDWSFLQCREHMTSGKDKRKAFHNVCGNFRPVMHYFFLERFLQPADWFEKRLSYTRSVAASSMVGYIVGLGDRHSMNILIDQTTAEVVHIDLGVAFEQGLMLKTPERVPFRLTRDIIDGMGISGVEGVFRRCCEETLSVMRTNKEALLTIIEVFIHDPLYKWALSPLKALQRQKETDDDAESSLEDSQDAYEGNKDAARALFRVKQKLDGYEDSEMRSVQGQVQQLIQDAIDIERLCQMFPGWGAWL